MRVTEATILCAILSSAMAIWMGIEGKAVLSGVFSVLAFYVWKMLFEVWIEIRSELKAEKDEGVKRK